LGEIFAVATAANISRRFGGAFTVDMKRWVSQLAAFNLVLPVKSHLMIISIYGSF
jgi:hypothetical protein